jgi:hypothetical protein
MKNKNVKSMSNTEMPVQIRTLRIDDVQTVKFRDNQIKTARYNLYCLILT